MHRTIMIQKLFNNKNQTGLLALAPFFLVVCSFNNGVIIGLTSLFMIIILTTILYLISNFSVYFFHKIKTITAIKKSVLMKRPILKVKVFTTKYFCLKHRCDVLRHLSDYTFHSFSSSIAIWTN